MWLNRNCQDLFLYQPPSSSTPYQTHKSSGRVLRSTKNSIFPPQSFFCWAAGGIMSEDETLTPPVSVPSESSLVWNCLSVRKKCSLSNLFSSCHHQGLPLSPGSCFPQKRKKEKEKAISKSDYSNVSPGWEIWLKASWNFNSPSLENGALLQAGRKGCVSWNIAVEFLFCHFMPQIYNPAKFFSKDFFFWG